MLAFASDGIFAVSVDSSLTRIAAAPVSGEGVMRRDAVCVTPEAVFVASGTGNLLNIKGSRVEIIPAPVIAKAVGYSARFRELWLVDGEGGAVTLSADMRVAARTLFKVKRFDNDDMAVDSNGGLRALDSEDPPMVPIVWRRRVRDSRMAGCNTRLGRRVTWTLDSERAVDLKLSILADNGGSVQPIIELLANGPVNAPIAATFRAPARTYLTASISGIMRPPTRLLSVCFT